MNKTQLSIASLLFAGLFATGCSQQQIQESTPEPTPAPMPEPEPEPAPAPTPAPVVIIKPTPAPAPIVVKPAPRRPINPNCHHHPANAMTKSIQHCHKNPAGQHRYGKRVVRPATPIARPIARPVEKPQVDVRALQRKLKAKGYYRGAIDGVVGNETRDALKRFQNR